MKLLDVACLLLLLLPVRAFDTTQLVTFDGSAGTTFTWSETNDPVMGGQSSATFTVKPSSAEFNGTCAIVPSLSAPGFCSAQTKSPRTFNDVSAHINGSLTLLVQSRTPEYSGFKVAFSATGVPRTSIYGGGSFKAGFSVPSLAVELIDVPFSSFSYDWSPYTGQCDTKDPTGQQHHCCGDGDAAKYCPTAEFLGQITDVEVWAEGVEGDFHLEILEISAVHYD